MSYDPNLPACCDECAQLYTTTYYQQSLETFLQSHNNNLNDPEELERNNTKVDRIAPIPVKGPGTGSSKPITRGPRHSIPETKPLNISRNKHNDPSIISTSVPTRSRRNPRKPGEHEHEPEIGIEYNPITSSVPLALTAQHRGPSNRTHNRQNSRETGANKPRKYNDDLPPIPTQDTNSSNGGRQLQYPEIQSLHSVDKPQAHVGSLSIPSVRTDERNQSNHSPSQIRPQTQQPRETRVSFSANKPRDSDHVNPPPVPNQGRSQSNFSQIRPQTQQPTRVSFSANKPWNSGHVEPPSVPIQEKNQSYFPPQTRSQSQESQTSSNANKFRDRAERPKAPIPTQDQGQGRSSASDASKTDTRPHLLHGTPSQMDTQYVNMLLALDDIPTLYNMLAKFFNWILLAGFILFPGTFTSLQNLGGSGQIEKQLLHAITSIPLFVIAWVCTGIGATGMLWLWWRWRKNYLWALNQIFMPGAMNSLAGFISTMANVYGVQHGELSTTSKVTIIVTAASTGVLGILTVIYTFWLVRRIKSRHDRTVGKHRTGKHGEGVVDLSKRKVYA